MTAKEAKEILSTRRDGEPGTVLPHEYFERSMAEGYLAALQGPEVFALVEALEIRGKFSNLDPFQHERDEQLLEEIRLKALDQYRKAVAP